MNTILETMQKIVEEESDNSDSSLFLSLFSYGEMILKIIALGMISGVCNVREKHQYKLLCEVVRADGIGSWAKTINEILTGPTSNFLCEELKTEQKQLTQKVKEGNWQYDMVFHVHRCLIEIGRDTDGLPAKVAAKQWFKYFVELRNKTKGHGATRGTQYTKICERLLKSIDIFVNNFDLFQRPWAHLHQNLSGKYRVTHLGGEKEPFSFLKREKHHKFDNGLYIFLDKLYHVELMEFNLDRRDLLLPNGNFGKKHYEMLSYTTNTSLKKTNERYLAPVGSLPKSETQGHENLDVIGNCFSNMPEKKQNYISRKILEKELMKELLLDDRHPIITLTGSGGTGKTTLALQVLHDLAEEERYHAIIWLSARDVDLFLEGPKLVKPHVISIENFSAEFVDLLSPSEQKSKDFKAKDYFADHFKETPIGPTLFVFDNFETVDNPLEVFSWIDTYIRLPNKVLITTRIREFSADFPIEVGGMTEEEAFRLIEVTSSDLGIHNIVSESYKEEIYQESGGHPYVIKVLLGEASKEKKRVKPARIVASQDEMLQALFERSYTNLSPAAKRIFLLLCNWRSSVPELALEAVVLRPENERMDVVRALDELKKFSLIDEFVSDSDHESFVSVPLAAMFFGKKKLTVSYLKSSIEKDSEILKLFGPSVKSNLTNGVFSRVERFVKKVSNDISKGVCKIDTHLPILQFMARKIPQVWIMIAELHLEQESTEKAIDFFLKYLESEQSKEIWKRIADLYEKIGNSEKMIWALVQISQNPDADLYDISEAANKVNQVFTKFNIDKEIKKMFLNDLTCSMLPFVSDFDSTDCSRLAWLYLHLDEKINALQYAKKGNKLDPDNIYCQRLLERLS